MLGKSQILRMIGAACLIILIIAGVSVIGYGSYFFAKSDNGTDIEETPAPTGETDFIDTVIIELNKSPVKDPSDETASDGENFQTGEISSVDETSSVEETSSEEETTTYEPEPSIYDGYLFADVKLYLKIRKEPNTSSEILGKLYVGDIATILEAGEEWTYITSGSVTGYVSNEYIVTGKAAEKYVIDEGLYVAKVTAKNLRLRAEANTDSEVYGSVYSGNKLSVISVEDGWVKVKHSSSSDPQGVAYVSAEYVELQYNFGKAISIEEEQEKIRLAKEAAEKAAREKFIKEILAKAKVVNVANRAPFDFSDEDKYLLACLVYTEAGTEPYEGQLAVANVVLNRYVAGYGKTLTEIIYAKNQFSPAQSGSLEKCLKKGPSTSCVRAALEAIAGVNNIGDYCHFITTSRANYANYYEYTIINRHCFYKKKW